MKTEDIFLVIGMIAVVSTLCNIWLLVEYLYHKNVIDKVRKLNIRELVSASAIIECCEPMQTEEQCSSISIEGFQCKRRKHHSGLHIASDFFKILAMWENMGDDDYSMPVPESSLEETQGIRRVTRAIYKDGKKKGGD
jgi:hypothetical protein